MSPRTVWDGRPVDVDSDPEPGYPMWVEVSPNPEFERFLYDAMRAAE